jgi:hypothetical protein
MYYVNAFSYTSNLCVFSIHIAHMCELIEENVHEHVCKATLIMNIKERVHNFCSNPFVN